MPARLVMWERCLSRFIQELYSIIICLTRVLHLRLLLTINPRYLCLSLYVFASLCSVSRCTAFGQFLLRHYKHCNSFGRWELVSCFATPFLKSFYSQLRNYFYYASVTRCLNSITPGHSHRVRLLHNVVRLISTHQCLGQNMRGKGNCLVARPQSNGVPPSECSLLLPRFFGLIETYG